MQLVTAATEDYLPYLCCLLVSITEHLSHGARPDITIIHRGIPDSTKHELRSEMAGSLDITWVEPTAAYISSIGAPPAFSTLSPHYFRLLTPYTLPDVSRAIYCDADTIVTAALDHLWDTDLEYHALAAVQDYLPRVADAVGNWQELGLDPEAPYFNSGVLVLDLARWRQDRIAQKALAICTRNAGHLFAQGKWPQHDQYGLNVVMNGRWKRLDPAWNHGADLLPCQLTPRIVHFVGNGKAGLSTCQPMFQDLFDRTLRRVVSRGLL